jgi:hypothetical protein
LDHDPDALRSGSRSISSASPLSVRPGVSSASLLALQRQAGNRAVSQLLQRHVIVGEGGGAHELSAQERQRFLTAHSSALGHWAERRDMPTAVLEDMAASADDMRFHDEAELERELVQRLRASGLMLESQPPPGHPRAFGYPYRGDARLYGPRVNFAARAYWDAHDTVWGAGPIVAVDYNDRSHSREAARIAHEYLTDADRARRFGDLPPAYSFVLNARGIADPVAALTTLFVPQPPHHRTLMHCDYLVTAIQLRAFAESLGPDEFRRRVQRGEIGHRVMSDGRRAVVLAAHGFEDLNVRDTTGGVTPADNPNWQLPTPGGSALRTVRVASLSDLVIGDHVRFYNHWAYDSLSLGQGVWSHENAILVHRDRGADVFLGHGSGQRTALGMREELLRHFNQYAASALADAHEADAHPNSARGRAAWASLRRRGVFRDGDRWTVAAVVEGRQLSTPLRLLNVDDIPGLYEPETYVGPQSPGQLGEVRRPAGSHSEF